MQSTGTHMQAAAQRLEAEKRAWEGGAEARQAAADSERSIRAREADVGAATLKLQARSRLTRPPALATGHYLSSCMHAEVVAKQINWPKVL